jgi:hypothetical protein
VEKKEEMEEGRKGVREGGKGQNKGRRGRQIKGTPTTTQ